MCCPKIDHQIFRLIVNLKSDVEPSGLCRYNDDGKRRRVFRSTEKPRITGIKICRQKDEFEVHCVCCSTNRCSKHPIEMSPFDLFMVSIYT